MCSVPGSPDANIVPIMDSFDKGWVYDRKSGFQKDIKELIQPR